MISFLLTAAMIPDLILTMPGPKLKQYMERGDSIYASDWAMSGLSRIPCLGQDEFSDGSYGGLGDTIYLSNITDVNLSTFLNKSNVTVKYRLNEWFSLDSNVSARSPFAKNRYGDGCSNFILNNRPLSLNINVGSRGGKLIYTTFRFESGQTPDGRNIMKFYLFEL